MALARRSSTHALAEHSSRSRQRQPPAGPRETQSLVRGLVLGHDVGRDAAALVDLDATRLRPRPDLRRRRAAARGSGPATTARATGCRPAGGTAPAADATGRIDVHTERVAQ